MSPSLLIDAIVIGVGASLVGDLWAVVRLRLIGVPPLDYRYVGRWLGHMRRGQFRHASIAAADPVPGEALFGTGSAAVSRSACCWLLVKAGLRRRPSCPRLSPDY